MSETSMPLANSKVRRPFAKQRDEPTRLLCSEASDAAATELLEMAAKQFKSGRTGGIRLFSFYDIEAELRKNISEDEILLSLVSLAPLFGLSVVGVYGNGELAFEKCRTN